MVCYRIVKLGFCCSFEKPSNVEGEQTWVMNGGVNSDSSSNADLPANGIGCCFLFAYLCFVGLFVFV